jgi:hypothetical protein
LSGGDSVGFKGRSTGVKKAVRGELKTVMILIITIIIIIIIISPKSW